MTDIIVLDGPLQLVPVVEPEPACSSHVGERCASRLRTRARMPAMPMGTTAITDPGCRARWGPVQRHRLVGDRQ